LNFKDHSKRARSKVKGGQLELSALAPAGFSRSAGHFLYTGHGTCRFFVRAILHTYNACNIQPPSMKPFLILLASFLALPACAGVYKWTDAQGRIHYSDSPPLAAKTTQLRLHSFTGPAQVSKAIGADSGVTIYTTEWCGVCKRAKAFFKQNGVPFREWDVEETDFGAVKFRQLGGSGVPLITVGSEKMMGFEANRFMALWKSTQSMQWPPANP